MAAADGGWLSVRSIRGMFEQQQPSYQTSDTDERDDHQTLVSTPPSVDVISQEEDENQEIDKVDSGFSQEQDMSPVLNFTQRKLAFQEAVDKKIINTSSSTKQIKVPPKRRNYVRDLSSGQSSSISSSDSNDNGSPDEMSNNSEPKINSYKYSDSPSSSAHSSLSMHSSPKSLQKENIFETHTTVEQSCGTDSDEEQDLDDDPIHIDMNNGESNKIRNKQSCRAYINDLMKNERSEENVQDDNYSALQLKSEKIPVFCVKDFDRGRNKDPGRNSGRSRSVGAELKPQGSQKKSSHKSNQSELIRNGSSDNIDQDQRLSSEFKDKQKMIEAVIKRGPKHAIDPEEAQQQSNFSKKSSNVFRKISFTSKQDKELHNKIAKGGIHVAIQSYQNPSHVKNYNNSEGDLHVFNKPKLSKIIPKLNNLPSTLKLPSNPLYKRKESPPSSPFNSKGKELTSHCKSFSEESKSEKTVTSEILPRDPPQRKTLPETDMKKFKNNIKPKLREHFILNVTETNENSRVGGNSLLKPSQIYTMRHSDPTEENARYDNLSLECSNSLHPPVRPPRRRNSGSPRKKCKAPVPPSDINENSSKLIKFSGCTNRQIAANSSESSVKDDKGKSSETNHFETETINSEFKSKLPAGPPPKKPPRTFAYEIYSNNKVRRLSKTTSCSLTHLSTNSSEENSEEITAESLSFINGINGSVPIYAVPTKKKRKSDPGQQQHRTDNNKPAIAPKPDHIKSTIAKRLSISEMPSLIHRNTEATSSLNKKMNRKNGVVSSFKNENESVAHIKSSSSECAQSAFQRQHSSPINRDDKRSCPLPDISVRPPPVTLNQCQDGRLNRQKSMSAETLGSSVCYYAKTDPSEPIYATPNLKTSNSRTRTSSGGDLHYMCSDLFNATQPKDISTEDICKRSPNSLLSAWRHELRQSCRQMQNKIKKTVTR